MGRWCHPSHLCLRILVWAIATPGAALALACGDAAPGHADTAHAELRIAVATSLRSPLEEIARLFADRETRRVEIGYGASNRLADQVRAGAPIDVLVSADAQVANALAEEGRVLRDGRRLLAHNRLVVVSGRSGRAMEDAADLLDAALRPVALAHPATPLGRYSRIWLRDRGLQEAVEAHSVGTEHARATLAAVDLGHAGAAIVYASDARLARRARVVLEIPTSQQPSIDYVAVAIDDRRSDDTARRFLAFLGDPAATRILEEAGLRLPRSGTTP